MTRRTGGAEELLIKISSLAPVVLDRVLLEDNLFVF